MSEENYLEMIEQLRHDRDKYLGMWRSQCNIAEEVVRERDRYKAALAEAMEEAKVWQDRYRKRGYVMDEHAKALERAEVAEAELARYKSGVEMDGEVRYILAAKSEGTCGKAQIIIPIIPIDDSLLIGNRVRVLVMKVEG